MRGSSRCRPAARQALARGIAIDQRPDHRDDILFRSCQPVLQREEIGAHILRGAGDEAQDLGQAAQHLHLPRARAGTRSCFEPRSFLSSASGPLAGASMR